MANKFAPRKQPTRSPRMAQNQTRVRSHRTVDVNRTIIAAAVKRHTAKGLADMVKQAGHPCSDTQLNRIKSGSQLTYQPGLRTALANALDIDEEWLYGEDDRDHAVLLEEAELLTARQRLLDEAACALRRDKGVGWDTVDLGDGLGSVEVVPEAWGSRLAEIELLLDTETFATSESSRFLKYQALALTRLDTWPLRLVGRCALGESPRLLLDSDHERAAPLLDVARSGRVIVQRVLDAELGLIHVKWVRKVLLRRWLMEDEQYPAEDIRRHLGEILVGSLSQRNPSSAKANTIASLTLVRRAFQHAANEQPRASSGIVRRLHRDLDGVGCVRSWLRTDARTIEDLQTMLTALYKRGDREVLDLLVRGLLVPRDVLAFHRYWPNVLPKLARQRGQGALTFLEFLLSSSVIGSSRRSDALLRMLCLARKGMSRCENCGWILFDDKEWKQVAGPASSLKRRRGPAGRCPARDCHLHEGWRPTRIAPG